VTSGGGAWIIDGWSKEIPTLIDSTTDGAGARFQSMRCIGGLDKRVWRRHPMVTKINLAEKFARFTDQWSPKIVADLNDSHVKLAKVQGEFVWHQHVEEDELFIVVQGELTIELRDGQVTLGPGEMIVIPRGVEHRPVAKEEVHLMLIEPKATRHTGDVVSERTVHEYVRI
jgi:mannose-6-phosphate isomerase-like protein (cupin superfamily)